MTGFQGIEVAGIFQFHEFRLAGVEVIQRPRRRAGRQLAGQRAQNGGGQMLDDLDTDTGIELRVEVAELADVIIRMATLIVRRRREQLDAMKNALQARQQRAERIEQLAGSGADIDERPDRPARVVKSLGHAHQGGPIAALGRPRHLGGPVIVPIVAHEPGIDPGQEFRIRKNRAASVAGPARSQWK